MIGYEIFPLSCCQTVEDCVESEVTVVLLHILRIHSNTDRCKEGPTQGDWMSAL